MLSKLYKLVFDVSVCYTIGAFLLHYFGERRIHIGGYLILLLTALVSSIIKHKRLVLLTTILLPFLSFVFVRFSIPELVVFLLIWPYLLYVTLVNRFDISRGEFADQLKRIVCLFLFTTVLILTNSQNYGRSIEVAGPYLAATLVSSVFLLRHLRAMNQIEQLRQYQQHQFVELLAFVIICLLLTLAKAPQNLVEGFKLLYLHLLAPILSLFTGVISILLGGIMYLILVIIGLLANNQRMQEIKNSLGETVEQSMDEISTTNASFDWIIPFLYSVGVLIGLVILFFFFRWLMRERYKQKLPSSILEIREDIEDTNRSGEFLKRRPKEARLAVRYYYRKSLLWLQQKKVQLLPRDTTGDICHKYNSILNDDDKVKQESSLKFMQLYRKARYRMDEQVTSEDAECAKKLYQMMKSSKNN